VTAPNWGVIGQGRAVAQLAGALSREETAHAYLIVGPSGVGKMKLARRFAQALNCTGETPPCGVCTACQRIEDSIHADVSVIELAASEAHSATLISTEQIDEVIASAYLPPFEGRHKVFIVDGAELLSTAAANKLLKTLEEPPPKVTFLLLTAQEAVILPTVVSRCQRLELPPAPLPQIEAALRDEWQAGEMAPWLARVSRGRPGWARRALDDETLAAARREASERIAGVAVANLEARFSYAGELAGLFTKDRQAVYEKLELWREWWRDLMLCRSGVPQAVVNTELAAQLEKQADGLTLTQVRTVLDEIDDAARALHQNVHPRLVLENLMLRIPEKTNA
jgi:DNA polymerase III subunit delta'